MFQDDLVGTSSSWEESKPAYLKIPTRGGEVSKETVHGMVEGVMQQIKQFHRSNKATGCTGRVFFGFVLTLCVSLCCAVENCSAASLVLAF
mmetsp:Transcript_49299/g.74441  ORF Transcript_49299/g.74441 Transcript_49299/m.74441 type:complete len:91 (+) Transcript_49299:36-308(+)